jgi:LPXTG-motif cell wall-anchored protein
MGNRLGRWLLVGATPAVLLLGGVAALPASASAAPVVASAHYGPSGPPGCYLSATTVVLGGSVTVGGFNFDAGETITITIHSAAPQTLGSTVANSSGAFSDTVTIPTDLVPGQHTITATGLTSGLSASATITLVSATTAVSSSAPTSSSTLPYTGADVAAASGVAGAAIAIGGGLVLASRKRRRSDFA